MRLTGLSNARRAATRREVTGRCASVCATIPALAVRSCPRARLSSDSTRNPTPLSPGVTPARHANERANQIGRSRAAEPDIAPITLERLATRGRLVGRMVRRSLQAGGRMSMTTSGLRRESWAWKPKFAARTTSFVARTCSCARRSTSCAPRSSQLEAGRHPAERQLRPPHRARPARGARRPARALHAAQRAHVGAVRRALLRSRRLQARQRPVRPRSRRRGARRGRDPAHQHRPSLRHGRPLRRRRVRDPPRRPPETRTRR